MRFSWIKIFFTPLRWIKNLLWLLTTCLFCQQTLTLLFLMFSIWTLGAAYALFYLHDPNWGQWSFVHLFDLTEARRTLNESSGVGKTVAVLLYGVTWHPVGRYCGQKCAFHVNGKRWPCPLSSCIARSFCDIGMGGKCSIPFAQPFWRRSTAICFFVARFVPAEDCHLVRMPCGGNSPADSRGIWPQFL